MDTSQQANSQAPTLTPAVLSEPYREIPGRTRIKLRICMDDIKWITGILAAPLIGLLGFVFRSYKKDIDTLVDRLRLIELGAAKREQQILFLMEIVHELKEEVEKLEDHTKK